LSVGIANFIQFEPGVTKWLVLSDPRTIEKEITDSLDDRRKQIQVRRWTVSREDGAFVNKTLDVTSIKFDSTLMTHYNLSAMDSKEIGITVTGTGFQKNYSVETRPFQV
jgi:hypothetical protein